MARTGLKYCDVPPLALRLAGLRAHCRLPYRSPDRCAASPPGNYAALHSAPGGGASACPGYRSTAVCHPVARTDAQHRLRGIMPNCALLPGAAQAPARATGPPPPAIPSPGQMRSIASGELCRTALCSRGRRKRLPGLQVHRRLPYRRPDRCAASPPGNYAELRSAPGGGASACPGYRSTAVCHTVARTDAQHRLREIMPNCALLPGAAQAPARATGPLPSAIP